MDLEDTCVKCYNAIFNNTKLVELNGHQYLIRKTKKSELRYVDVKVGRETFRIIEQDPLQVSSWAEKARQGNQIAWVRKGQANYARIIDGVFKQEKSEWKGHRIVLDSGCFRVGGRLFFIGKRYLGATVTVNLDGNNISCTDMYGRDIPVLREVGKNKPVLEARPSGKNLIKPARKSSKRQKSRAPRPKLLEAKFPFIVENAFLIAQVNKETGRQRLVMKKIDPETGKTVIKDAISCIHTAVTTLPAEQLEDKIESESFAGELLYIRSTERLKQVILPIEDRFLAFKSWVAGIAEAGMDAFKIQSATEEEGKLIYPIAKRLMAFAAKVNPELLEDFLHNIVRECQYEGIQHDASLLANLEPFVRFAVEKRNSLILEAILNLDIPFEIYLELIPGEKKQNSWVFPKVAGKNAIFMQAFHKYAENHRADPSFLQQVQSLLRLGGSPEILDLITTLKIIPHLGKGNQLKKTRIHLLKRTLETKICLGKLIEGSKHWKEIYWWGESNQSWGETVIVSTVPHVFFIYFSDLTLKESSPETAIKKVSTNGTMSVVFAPLSIEDVTDGDQTKRFQFLLSAPYFEGETKLILEFPHNVPGFSQNHIEFPIIHELYYKSSSERVLEGLSGVSADTEKYLKEEFRKAHMLIDPLPLEVFEQGLKLLGVLAAWLEEENQTSKLQQFIDLLWNRVQSHSRYALQSWFFSKLRDRLRMHFLEEECTWAHPAIWIRDIPLEYKTLKSQSHSSNSYNALNIQKLWILNRLTWESMEARLGIILVYDYRQNSDREVALGRISDCIKFQIQENRVIFRIVMLGNQKRTTNANVI